MKSVSAAFKNAQASPSSVSLRRVSYKRRYWDQPTQKFIWEGSWTTLSESEVVSVSAITAKLDTDAVNEFKISNLTITLKNADRRWTSTNPFGLFGKDSASPVNGYEPYWTKFRVETGYVVSGVDTYVTMFVGVAIDFKTEGNSDTMQIDVQGLEALLQNANAELVSTFVENETMVGNADGANKEFTTAFPGVGIIYSISVDGVDKPIGNSCSVSDLNDPSFPGKVSFNLPPSSGAIVKASYRYWKQNQQGDWLVKDLLSVAGFTSGDWVVDEPIMPWEVGLSGVIDSQHEWSQNSSITDVTSSYIPGSLAIDLQSGSNIELANDFSSIPLSYVSNKSTGGATGTNGITSGKFRYTCNSDTGIYRIVSRMSVANHDGYALHTRNRGMFSFEFQHNYDNQFFQVYFFNGGGDFDIFEDGCVLRISSTTDSLVMDIESDSATIRTVLFGSGLLPPIQKNVTHTAKVIFMSDDRIDVWIDGKLCLSGVSQVSWPVFNWMFFDVSVPGKTGGGNYMEIDNIYIPSPTLSGSYTSQTIDLKATPTRFNPVAIVDTVYPGGALTYKTRTSDDGTSWDSFLDIENKTKINSSLKRYLQFKIDFNGTTDVNQTNTVDSIKFSWATNKILIRLANFTGKTVYDAIGSIAKLTNNEWGFGADEKFFFRPKSVDATIDETLDASKNIIELSAIGSGFKNVYDEVQATFGVYNVTSTKYVDNNKSPFPRFGHKRMEISNDDLLISDDTDVATGVSRGLLDYYSKPRRTCKVRTKLMEWIDLSDTVSVTFRDKPVNWWIGDTQVSLGQTNIYLHGPESNTLDGFVSKVVGYRHDTENKTSEFDLEEIVQ